MFCHACGEENSDSASFCRQCGAKLNADAQPAVSGDVSNEQAVPAQQAAPIGAQAAPEVQTAPNAQYAAPNAQATYQASQQPYTFKIKSDNIDNKQYVASAFGSGWSDISNSKGWFVRSLLLGLCSLVPILRWIVGGYASRWGREICLGVNRRLPENIFEDGTFVTGAKIWVVNFLYILGFACTFFIFMLIPILGPIIWICAVVAYSFISPLLDFQVALSGKISAGFTGLGRTFKLVADKPLKTLITTVAPSVITSGIVGLVSSIIGGIIFLIMCSGALGSFTSTALMYSGNTSHIINSGISSIAGVLTGSMILLYLIWFVLQIAGAVSNIWTYRAIGHFIAREAPEWLAVPGLVDVSTIDVSSGTFKPFVPFQE